MNTRKVIVPDYDVSIGDDRPFKVRIAGITAVIGDIELTTPGDDIKIDNAVFKYTYEIESGEFSDEITEEQFIEWLNPIVSGELNDFINNG